ncbi:TPA: hypothetical protein EYP83_00725 [Candidatus Geothermarchaeota archaeon]|nr:hypothetical protein [Candidatus Geothermarchaeota archaeon]
MLKATIDSDKIKRWIKVLTTIDAMVDEACFYISNSEFIFRDLDNTRINMINVTFQREYFDVYEYSGDSPTFVCVQSDKLLKYSKALSKADELTIEVAEGKFIISSSKPYMKKFILPAYYDEERELPRVPDIDYSVYVRLVTPTLRDILKESKDVSETITLYALNNEIQFISKSEEGFQSIHKLKYPDNVELLDISVDNESTSVYTVKPIYDIVKEITTISGVVTLQFSSEYPLTLKFDMLEYETYQFITAPRSEE